MSDVVSEEIPESLDGERLDRIVSLITEVSRSDAAAVIAAGGVTVDGSNSPSGKIRLKAGQVVSVDLDLLPQEQLPQADP